MQGLIENAVLVLDACPVEHAVPPEILSADDRIQILPLGIFRICGRLDWIRADVAEATGHPNPIRSYEIAIGVVVGIVIEPVGIPPPARVLVEIRVGEQAKADDSRGFAVVGTHIDGLAAAPIATPG